MQEKEYPKYAIFDMDGTLLDSMRYWRGGARDEYLLSLGLEPSEEARSARLTDLPALLAERYGIEVTLSELWQKMLSIVSAHYRTDVVAYRNVVEILHGIVRTGGRAVILTATSHPYCDEALGLFGLRDLFCDVITAEDNGGVGKRDPSAFRLALDRLGCNSPAECRVYEDALYSIKTAKAMGFSVTAVLDPTAARDRDEILALADEAIEPIRGCVGERFPYRYALFDMDGTLLDSMRGLTIGYHTVLSRALAPEYRRDVDFFAPFACFEAKEAFRRISEALGVSLDTEALMADLLAEAERRYREIVRPFPEMLSRLKALKADGVKLGIITATPHPLCDIAVKATGLSEYISLVMTPEDNGGVGKQDPSIFRLALSRLGGEDLTAAAMYEDAVYSLETAKTVGMRCVAVLDPMAKERHTKLMEIADEVVFPTPVSQFE